MDMTPSKLIKEQTPADKNRNLTKAPDIAHLFPDSMQVAVYNCDQEGWLTYFNKAAEMLWGRKPEIGTDRWSGAWKIYTPEGIPISFENIPAAGALDTGMEVPQEEMIIQRPDGSKSNILSRPVLLYSNEGNIIGFMDTLIDISLQRKAEAKQLMLEAIIKSSDDAIITFTPEGIITSWNEGAEKMLDYLENYMIGKPLKLIIPESQQKTIESLIQRLKNGEKIEKYETILSDIQGKEIPVSIIISPLKDTKGNIIGISKNIRSVSNQNFEDKLSQYDQQLESLIAVSMAMCEDLEIEALLSKLTAASTRIIGATVGAFFHNGPDNDGQYYTRYSLSGLSKKDFEQSGMLRSTDIFDHTFRGKGTIRLADISIDPHYQNLPYHKLPKSNLQLTSYLAVPVVSSEGNILGGLFFGHHRTGMFTNRHEILAEQVAHQAAIALENVQI